VYQIVKADAILPVQVVNGIQSFDGRVFVDHLAPDMTKQWVLLASDFDQFIEIL
jgi:hypothetical protein